jgi:hypothetical protein
MVGRVLAHDRAASAITNVPGNFCFDAGSGSRAFRPQKRTGDFSFLVERKVHQKKDTPGYAPSAHPALRVRVRRRDFSTVHPCTDEKRRASCAPPFGFTHRHPPLRRGPKATGIVPVDRKQMCAARNRALKAKRQGASSASASAGTMPAASRGPCGAASAGGKDPQGDVQDAHRSPSAHGCGVGESRRRSRTRRTGCPQGASMGCPSFWFRLSWTSKKDEPVRFADGTLLI